LKGQRGCVVRKGTSYFIKYRGPEGKQIMQGSRPGHGFRSHQEAQQRLHEILSEINRGDYIEAKSIRFRSFADNWINERISIRGSTSSAYASLIRQNLVPHLGTLHVHEIQLLHVQSLVSKLASSLSVKTVRNAFMLLRVMLVGKMGPSAIKLGYLRHDPTKGVELPQLKQGNVRPPAPEEVWALINTAEEKAKESQCAYAAHAMIFLEAFTGLRRGELLALRHTDIDWFTGEIVVARSISKAKAHDGVHKWLWNVGPTKNGKTRRVGVGDHVLRLLGELKQRVTNDEGFIFTPTMVGLPALSYPFIAPDYFNTNIYAPIVASAELAHIRFHDLRHFFASMLIAQGESAKYVSDQLGHSSIQVTFDTYGHLFPQSRREASSKLEQTMFAARKEPSVENVVENRVSPASKGAESTRPN
jgi:integrase